MNKESTIFKNIIAVLLILGLAAGTASATQAPVNLGTAGNFVILAKTGISTTGTTSIVGDIGVSPIASTAITGFGLIMDASNKFSTSSLVTGKVYAANYAPPTPSTMTTAVSDMQTAYTDASGRTSPDHTELGAGNIGGMTLTPGLYKWGTGVTIPPGGVTLSGGANDVWIFQIAQDLTVANGAKVTLSGGAQASNIFWQVAGKTTIGTTSDFKGIILSKTLISLNTDATLDGRALAQTAVTLIANVITAPGVNPTNTPRSTGVVTGTPANPTVTATPAKLTVTATPTKLTVTATPAKPTVTTTPAPTNKVPGFEFALAIAILSVAYLFGKKRR
ncbi:MAG: ice-binding family protein [Candidatus Methanoperedens sp.]|nr:ice-binding family protein [Candidatus Methanoperedens sp.]MCZ7369361.1 ice-binding family protein [Candidatus Methanoperedens sp.]